MIIQMPPMCGMQTHPNLMSKVEKAIKKRDFPIDLNCGDTAFTTSMFMRFVLKVNRQVTAAGGTLRLTNVDEVMYEGLSKTGVTDILEITRRSTPGKKRKVKHG